MKKLIILSLLWLSLGSQASAQEIQLNEPTAVSQLLRDWTNNNRTKPGVQGWRVQVTASTDRVQVEDSRNRFRQAHPDVPADWIHEKPYYKLRVGAFRTRQEAALFINTLTGLSGAFAVPDNAIHPRDFID